MEIKLAPGAWQWEQGVIGWMLFDGTRQVAWFADKDEAEVAAWALEMVKKIKERQSCAT